MVGVHTMFLPHLLSLFLWGVVTSMMANVLNIVVSSVNWKQGYFSVRMGTEPDTPSTLPFSSKTSVADV